MKISGRKQVGSTNPLSGASRPKSDPVKADAGSGIDGRAADVNLSESLREMDHARQALASMPDVRAEKVGALKPVVDDGTYHRESKVIAKKMVDSALRESAQSRVSTKGK